MKSIEEINKEIQRHKETISKNEKEKLMHQITISTLKWVIEDKKIDLFKDYNMGW